jgi:hypothetical protein
MTSFQASQHADGPERDSDADRLPRSVALPLIAILSVGCWAVVIVIGDILVSLF